MIKPTVGRVVWYHPGPNFRGHYEDSAEPLAAHVARVRDNYFGYVLNLMVIDANGVPSSMLDVPLVQEGEKTPSSLSGWCQWMPYQLGQAAKTDEVEAALRTGKAARAAGKEEPY